MFKYIVHKVTFFLLVLLFPLSLLAQPKTTVSATVDKKQILIGQPVVLTLEADVPESEPIRFFQIDSIPHFEFLSRAKIDTLNTGTGTVLSQVIRITSFDSGHWVIPAFALGDQLMTDTLPVDVGYAPFDPQQAYHDIKDIIEVNPEEKKDRQPWWWYAAGGGLVLAILLFFLLRKKKKPVIAPPPPPPDPFKVAIEGLEKLRREKPEAKQYYSRLVDIFRVYIAEKKGVLSLQKTTDDLVVQLRSQSLPTPLFERLAQSLRMSDFVKFAKYIPSAEDDGNAWQTLKESIEQVELMK